MSIIKPLPSWALINRFPAFYDGESLTAIEQTARLYGKVKELVETYNRYVTEMNGELTELETQVQKDLTCAIRTIINLTDSYITHVELRLTHQDRKLDENYKQFADNVVGAIEDTVRHMAEGGKLDQSILDAVDNLNTKFENVQSSIAEEQAALKADYEAVSKALSDEFADSMEAFDGWITTVVERIQNNVANLSESVRREVSEVVNTLTSEHVFTPVDGFIGNDAYTWLKDYHAVVVHVEDEKGRSGSVICSVEKSAVGVNVRGRGSIGDCADNRFFGDLGGMHLLDVEAIVHIGEAEGRGDAYYVQHSYRIGQANPDTGETHENGVPEIGALAITKIVGLR